MSTRSSTRGRPIAHATLEPVRRPRPRIPPGHWGDSPYRGFLGSPSLPALSLGRHVPSINLRPAEGVADAAVATHVRVVRGGWTLICPVDERGVEIGEPAREEKRRMREERERRRRRGWGRRAGKVKVKRERGEDGRFIKVEEEEAGDRKEEPAAAVGLGVSEERDVDERQGEAREGEERKGEAREGEERKGEAREGEERKGEERKEEERKGEDREGEVTRWMRQNGVDRAGRRARRKARRQLEAQAALG